MITGMLQGHQGAELAMANLEDEFQVTVRLIELLNITVYAVKRGTS